ncbi:hypothetical protein [Modicisalibacter xianhensis]|uniref:Uncharacterized protein n=1 Tax=Modicisalibacter xianhensis TaxID=442341 RepID=A0A1I3EN34_9GAMM|nr:hypothetical protein [Halomonas xianhensis]SFI00283.1 hypothetical protein SAMN04487959_11461 [Halomonas xianhensis]
MPMSTQDRLSWRRWNLDYTKRLLANDPESQMARAVLSCWPARIQHALGTRFGLTKDEPTTEPETRTYTAFCHQRNGVGTIWIGTVEVPIRDYREDEQMEAVYQARCACARDWGWHFEAADGSSREDISEIVCMGLAEGDVTIAMWDDTHLE